MARPVEGSSVRLLLVGAPGSGKGTQCERIERDFGVHAVSSGDILRRHIRQGTQIGKEAEKIIKAGELIPNEIILDLLLKELDNIEQKHWLLDGFPRNVDQAQSLHSHFQPLNQQLNLVINLEVPEEVILGRILDRWVHIPSGRVYNLSYNPPKVPGKDDITGEPLSKRDDDKPEVFKTRLDHHHRLTEPLLEFYDKQGVLMNVKGETSDIIYPQIQKILAESMYSPTS
ncbi:adenylate kinase [Conidiobolus coronatus NRRL 28638]|uniref:GTP:AMP phosphotransferase, mitochondrial n=1 Tax=Conidiobolus coronatus (strain ATCC 28846 / CBS 209.66 / NRRL 28638) TaxID=796925 RepID=A0A137NW19_CONC2|nr:adenylate kinase [Conidiobolus coronatus NRRL 28638]|eukprot:KXN66829.1 adenylate kinase [Conidiobolus coronatus NRRL 28638]